MKIYLNIVCFQLLAEKPDGIWASQLPFLYKVCIMQCFQQSLTLLCVLYFFYIIFFWKIAWTFIGYDKLMLKKKKIMWKPKPLTQNHLELGDCLSWYGDLLDAYLMKLLFKENTMDSLLFMDWGKILFSWIFDFIVSKVIIQSCSKFVFWWTFKYMVHLLPMMSMKKC